MENPKRTIQFKDLSVGETYTLAAGLRVEGNLGFSYYSPMIIDIPEGTDITIVSRIDTDDATKKDGILEVKVGTITMSLPETFLKNGITVAD